jgi:hypothetical protein
MAKIRDVQQLKQIPVWKKVEQTQSKTLATEIKDECLKLIDEFTMHGFPNIFRASSLFIKAMWLIAFACSTSFCIYMTIQSVFAYLEYDVVTKIRVQTEIPFTMPAITLCNKNPFVTESGYRFVQEVLAMNGIEDVTNSTVLESSFKVENHQITPNMIVSNYLATTYIKGANVSDALRTSFGFSFEKFFITCLFDLKQCRSADFVWHYDSTYGNCYTFNSEKFLNGSRRQIKTVNKPGKLNGFHLELFVGNPTHINSLAFSTGVHLFIQNQSSRINTNLGMNVATGFSTDIVLSKTVHKRLPYPYSKCQNNFNSFDSELYRVIIESGHLYTQPECFNLCIQQQIIQKCKCYDTNIPPLYDVRPCSTFRDLGCLNFMLVFLNFINELKKTCEAKCPLECETVFYTTTQSISKYPSRAYGDYLLKDKKILNRFDNQSNLTINDLRETILAINIYIDSYEYTQINEIESQTLLNLIASCGGTFGLFIGISFLSILEILEVVLRSFMIFMNGWKIMHGRRFQV